MEYPAALSILLIFRKVKTMHMTNKTFIRTVCPIIALFFFFTTISPAVVRAQATEKSGNAPSLGMLKLAMAWKNGQVVLSKNELLAVKKNVLIRVENLFHQIEQSGFSEKTMQKYVFVLPQGFPEKIILVASIAKTDFPTEEKLNTLAGAFGYSCDDIMCVGVVAFVLSYCGVITHLGYFGSLLFAAAALCYLGVL